MQAGPECQPTKSVDGDLLTAQQQSRGQDSPGRLRVRALWHRVLDAATQDVGHVQVRAVEDGEGTGGGSAAGSPALLIFIIFIYSMQGPEPKRDRY